MTQILFIIYIIFLIGFLIFSSLGIYHLWRFGLAGGNSKKIIFGYSIFVVAIIIISFIAIGALDWQASWPSF